MPAAAFRVPASGHTDESVVPNDTGTTRQPAADSSDADRSVLCCAAVR
jgi:hypothetical protein